ncbi:unnamed protein product [Ilex paraguariensis]|uniref:PAZ domain-containing protein n=1 Tax=Ilex paraguariensis TaxID=185542 RepID=A0ABC8T6C9_9AQUA
MPRLMWNKMLAKKETSEGEICRNKYVRNRFAYDGDKNLYTLGPLPENNFEFMVVLQESFAKHGSPPHNGSPRADPDNVQDALKVLDVILGQQATIWGSLLVRRSFFHDDLRNFTDVGGALISLGRCIYNYDLTPGSVIDFLLANQNACEPCYIDWAKAKRMLKNIRIKTRHNREFKIIGLSDKPCNQLFFPLKVKNSDGAYDGGQTTEIMEYKYFSKHRNIELILHVCIALMLLKVGNSEDCFPHNGQWNFNNKVLPTQFIV